MFPTERHSQWVLRLYDHSQRGTILSDMYQVIQRANLLKGMIPANPHNGWVYRMFLDFYCHIYVTVTFDRKLLLGMDLQHSLFEISR